jgi:hypothetical protein
MHADVTRNHHCKGIDELLGEVRQWIARWNRQAAASNRKMAA